MRVSNHTGKHSLVRTGHSLPETIIAVSLVGVMFISLYAGFSAGFAMLSSTRENHRATEILNQQAERLRLLSWKQVLDAEHFLPSPFDVPLNAEDSSTSPVGAVFHGTIESVAPTDWPAAYQDHVRLITVTLTWTNFSGSKPMVNRRQMQTCVSRFGMQNYLAAP